MNVAKMLWENARGTSHHALPILSFPAVQKLNVRVDQLVKNAELQAEVMACIAQETPTLAAVSLMDLSVEAEAFGANVVFSDNEVPVVTGQM